MAKAEAADKADLPDGLSIPDDLARREEQLKKLAEARAKIEARAKKRYERELAEHRAKSPRLRKNRRPQAESLAASRPSRRLRGRAQRIRSI